MEAFGVIAEFNPFHYGHRYLLAEGKKLNPGSACVVIMSGNFLQRGEPAIVNKWKRTQMALNQGADLVVEIPVEESIQSANNFARAGVRIATLLQVRSLVFGSEHPKLDFQKLASTIDARNERFQSYNMNFAQQLFANVTVSSNDILGINYTYWSQKLNSHMALMPVQRVGDDFNESTIKSKQFASATAIRKEILENGVNGQLMASVLPKETMEELSGDQLVSWNDFFKLLKYRIITSSTDELSQLLNIKEGFQNRIISQINQSSSYGELINRLSTKRYSVTSIQRMLVAILLNIPATVDLNSKPRILGMGRKGQKYLAELDHSNLLLSRVSQKDFDKDYFYSGRADNVYKLISPAHFVEKTIIV